ncbi:MAG: type II secretion system secretin GspD [Gammaproteobacteria bacterium]|nr:type II secretion system secretin GspD [Gammaproteobacteria bacterium]
MLLIRRCFLLCLLLIAPVLASSQDDVKINLKNVDIRIFITQVSTITGKSFIVDPRVKGNVTVISNTFMDRESVYQLFLSVLRVHGYAAVPAGNVTKIVQQVLAKQSSNPRDFDVGSNTEELVTRVVPIRNAPSIDLVKILRPLIPQYGHVAGLQQPNVLIISDHASNINRLTEIISRIDVADNLEVAIIGLKEAWVEDMIALLEQLAPDQIGKSAKGPNKITIVASERTNSLVLKGERETIARVKSLIIRLDVPANRSGGIQVVRLAHADAKQMAEILNNLMSDKSSTDKSAQEVGTSIQADEALNALVIRADPSTMLDLKEIIASLDVRRRQVLIEAAIVEVTTDFNKQLGTEFFVGDSSGDTGPIGITAPSGTLAQLLQALALRSSAPRVDADGNSIPLPPVDLGGVDLGETPLLAGGRFSRGGTSFAFIVRALASNSDVNLLSTPSITTMDNEEAKIVVGQNVPFRTGSTVSGSQGATNPFTTIQREDVGITLQVTPHINEDNLVRLEIHQEVSEVDPASLNVIGSNAAADLITNKRTIDTTVLVDDGETIILGGLTRDKETFSSSKVPILGSIPVLGFLFRSETKSIEKQNLLVFLRPTVLATRDDIATQTERKFLNIYEVEIEGTDPAESLSELFNGIN